MPPADKSNSMVLVFEGFSGGGVMAVGDKVTLGLRTDKTGLDLTMTKDQARELGAKLATVAK